jgi:hypothetical protein
VYNITNVLVQNCLLDVYALNSTAGAMATDMVSAQIALQAVKVPTLNVTGLSQSQAVITVNGSLSSTLNGGQCAALFVCCTPPSNQTQCAYVLQLGPSYPYSTFSSYSPVDIEAVLSSANSDNTKLYLEISTLTVATTYYLRMALLVTSQRLVAPCKLHGLQSHSALWPMWSIPRSPIA